MKVFVTGAAGFIGFHVSKRLLEEGHEVTGLDNLNDYYPVVHKIRRIDKLKEFNKFYFVKIDIKDKHRIWPIIKQFPYIVHLAAQAGVRHSLKHPDEYIENNMTGFISILDLIRKHPDVKNFVYASSSSVYGGKEPFSEKKEFLMPTNMYALSKYMNEIFCKNITSKLNTPSTGLRFFTAYGPYARPDQAMYIFADKMSKGSKVPLFNKGEMIRDFTYIDDIVDGILLALNKPQMSKVYNLGSGQKTDLKDVVTQLQSDLNIKNVDLDLMGMQEGDVKYTLADLELVKKELGYEPKVEIKEGLKKFAEWFRQKDC